MTSHSLVNLTNAAPVIETPADTATRPAPTLEQEHLADDVFTPQQVNLANAVIGMQLGYGILHILASEAKEALAEEKEPLRPRRKEATDPQPAS